jgi:hypothetical protein
VHLAVSGHGRWRWFAPAAVLLAIGSKESAAVLPILLLYFTWAMERRPAGSLRGESGSRTAPSTVTIALVSIVPVLLYVVCRRFGLGTWLGPHPEPSDNPMVGTGILSRLPTVLDTAGRSIGLLLWPPSSRWTTPRRF